MDIYNSTILTNNEALEEQLGKESNAKRFENISSENKNVASSVGNFQRQYSEDKVEAIKDQMKNELDNFFEEGYEVEVDKK